MTWEQIVSKYIESKVQSAFLEETQFKITEFIPELTVSWFLSDIFWQNVELFGSHAFQLPTSYMATSFEFVNQISLSSFVFADICYWDNQFF